MKKLAAFIEGRAFVYLSITWFSFQASFLAATTKYGVPPDERYHKTFIELYREKRGIFFSGEQPGFEWLGEASRSTSYLYHFLLSAISNVSDSLLVLRLLNVAMVTVALYFVYKIFQELKISKLAAGLGIFMLANTLMLIFLAGSLNYDNLSLPLSLLAILLTLKIINKPSPMLWLGLLATSGAASIVKYTFIPLGIPLLLLAAFYSKGQILKIFRNYASELHRSWTLMILSLTLVLICALVSERYIGNKLIYGSFMPSCDRVYSTKYCEVVPNNIRIKEINDKPRPKLYSRTTYLSRWAQLMRDRTFSATGHKVAPANKLVKSGIVVILIFGLVAFIRIVNWHRDKKIIIVFTVSAIYCATVYASNAGAYLSSGWDGIAVQGRYLFPALPFLYVLVTEFPLRILKRQSLMTLYAVGIILVFSLAGLPNYLVTANSNMRSGTLDIIYKKSNSVGCKVNQIFSAKCS